MRVALIANPRSGRGRALRLLESALAALRGQGHAAEQVALQPAGAMAGALRGFEAAVIFGGDGTIHSLLPALRESRAAVYHAPLGTENLFSREFGSRRDATAIAAAADRGTRRAIDLGVVSAGEWRRPFAIMLSAGPDAGVIRRLHAARRGAITHAAYIAPVFAEMLRPSLPQLTIEVDGREVVSRVRGIVVVANMRQYGLRSDPAAGADPADGLFDVVFMPCSTGPGALARTAAARFRRHGAAVVEVRGCEVRLRSDEAAPVQADGELLDFPAGPLDLRMSVDPGALGVLVPA